MVQAMARRVHLLYAMAPIAAGRPVCLLAPCLLAPAQRPKRRRCPVCLTAATKACTAGSAERRYA